jgi:hypothetical protein
MSEILDDLSTFTDMSKLSELKDIPKQSFTSKENSVSETVKSDYTKIKQDGSVKSVLSHSTSSSSSSGSSGSDCNYCADKITCIEQTIQCFDKIAMNKVFIDIAVVSEEYTKIELMCNDHIVNLDEIDVSMEIFQIMFYPYKENFGINKDFFLNNVNLIQFISFSPKFRTVNGKRFDLLEELIGNIETDLSVSRNCFTKDSLVELTNEITNIKSLLDIKCCSVMSSLTWENILDIINNYKLTKCEVIPVLIINIVFKSDTAHVKDTIIRFQYKICKNS